MRIPTLVRSQEDDGLLCAAGHPASRLGDGNLDRFNPTNNHNPMMDGKGRVVVHGDAPSAGRTSRPGARTALATSSRSTSRSRAPAATSASTIRRRASSRWSTPASARTTCSSAMTPTRRCTSAARTARCSAGSTRRSSCARRDGQATQGWCPTVVDTNGDGKITKPWNEPMVQRGTRRRGGRRLRSGLAELRSEARHAGQDRRLRDHRESRPTDPSGARRKRIPARSSG